MGDTTKPQKEEAVLTIDDIRTEEPVPIGWATAPDGRRIRVWAYFDPARAKVRQHGEQEDDGLRPKNSPVYILEREGYRVAYDPDSEGWPPC